VLLYRNGRVYEGEWENGRKHGRGYEVFASKAIYEGQFVNGRPEGSLHSLIIAKGLDFTDGRTGNSTKASGLVGPNMVKGSGSE
jgi:hypothetical protein